MPISQGSSIKNSAFCVLVPALGIAIIMALFSEHIHHSASYIIEQSNLQR